MEAAPVEMLQPELISGRPLISLGVGLVSVARVSALAYAPWSTPLACTPSSTPSRTAGFVRVVSITITLTRRLIAILGKRW